MKLYLDTEFTGLHKNTTLISLAITTNIQSAFYAELTDYDAVQCDEWINTHVINNLVLLSRNTKIVNSPQNICSIMRDNANCCEVRGTKNQVKIALNHWLELFEGRSVLDTAFDAAPFRFEIYGDVNQYDWVLFCDLFGGALNLPRNIHYISFDLATAFKLKGINPDINRQEWLKTFDIEIKGPIHNAFTDSEITRACWNQLEKLN